MSSQATSEERPLPKEALDDPAKYIRENPEEFERLAEKLKDDHPEFAAVTRRAVEEEAGVDSA